MLSSCSVLTFWWTGRIQQIQLKNLFTYFEWFTEFNECRWFSQTINTEHDKHVTWLAKRTVGCQMASIRDLSWWAIVISECAHPNKQLQQLYYRFFSNSNHYPSSVQHMRPSTVLSHFTQTDPASGKIILEGMNSYFNAFTEKLLVEVCLNSWAYESSMYWNALRCMKCALQRITAMWFVWTEDTFHTINRKQLQHIRMHLFKKRL